MGKGTTGTHFSRNPDRLHDLGLGRVVAQRRLGMALDTVGALGDMGDSNGDQLLGLCIQRTIGKNRTAEGFKCSGSDVI